MRIVLMFACVVPLLVPAGCGGGKKASPPAQGPAPTASSPRRSATAKAEAPAPPGHLPRSAVLATLSHGLGAFLGRLDTEPVVDSGHFRGWRIVRVADRDPMWKGVDLGPGDVVTRVNGKPIERPEQALNAFQGLAIDPQLRVAYERNGKPRELVYVIDDPPPR
jgi:type II secretory pathway component PulC